MHLVTHSRNNRFRRWGGALVVLAAVLGSALARARAGELLTVTVSVEEAAVRAEGKEVAKVPKGRRFGVLSRTEAGLEVVVGEGTEARQGRLRASDVRVLGDADADVAEDALEFGRALEPELDVAAARRRVTALVGRLAKAAREGKTPREQAERLSDELFVDEEFTLLSDLTTLDYAVKHRACDPLTMAVLYLCAAREAGLAVRLVEGGGQVFLRCEGAGQGFIIAPARDGACYEDEAALWKAARVEPPEPAQGLRLVSLPAPRVLGLLHRAQGERLSEDRHGVQACEHFARAVEVNPRDARAWAAWGKVADRLGFSQEAAGFYKRACELNPCDPKAWVARGYILARLGQDAEADGCFARAVELAPGEAWPHCSWGWALWPVGRLEEAVREFQAAHKLRPDDGWALAGWGAVLADQGAYLEAISRLASASQLDPDYWRSRYYWGLSLGRLGRHHEAAAVLQGAIVCEDASAEAYWALAMARAHAGQVDQADALLKRAAALDLGLAYEIGVVSRQLRPPEHPARLGTDETVVIAPAAAPLLVGGKEVARLERGRHFGVLRREGEWVEIRACVGGALWRGRVRREHVRAVEDASADLCGAAAAIGCREHGERDVAAVRQRLAALVERTAEAVGRDGSPRERLRRLGRHLSETEGIEYKQEAHGLDHVVEDQRGNCMSLSLIYLCVARKLGLPVRLVVTHQHAFVRYDDGTTWFDVEAARPGRLRGAEDYLRRLPAAAESRWTGQQWLRGLPDARVVGLLSGVSGRHLHEQARYDEAWPLFARAVEINPLDSGDLTSWAHALAEAHRYDQAFPRYELAAELRPGDKTLLLDWASALRDTARDREAAEKLAQASQLRPDDIDLLIRWAGVLDDCGDYAEARAKLDQALRLCEAQGKDRPDDPSLLMNWSWALGCVGRWPEAREKLAKAAELSPKSAFTWRYLGSQHSVLGDHAQACQAYEKAAQLDPEDARARALWSYALVLEGKPGAGAAGLAEAADLCEKATERNPLDADAWDEWSDALAMQGKLEDAAAKIRKIVELNPRHASAHETLGARLLRLGHPDEACEHLARAAELRPHDAGTLSTWAVALGARGRFAEARRHQERALAELDASLAAGPEDGGAHVDAARLLLRLGALPKARRRLRKAIELQPWNAGALEGLAAELIHRAKVKETRPLWKRAHQRSPHDADILLGWGDALARLGKWPQAKRKYAAAVKELRRLAKAFPHNGGVHSDLGDALHRLGRYDAAFASYAQAVRLAPRDRKTLCTWGEILHRAGRYAEACEKLERAARLSPHESGVWVEWGRALEALGRADEAKAKHERAIAVLGEAVEVYPDHPTLLNSLGWALAMAARHAEARDRLVEAVALVPDEPHTLHSLAYALAGLGQHAEACKHYAHAAEVHRRAWWAYADWGHSLVALGKHAEACEKFAAAIAILPFQGEACLGWGKALAALGKAKEARARLARALELQPALKPQIDKLLAQLDEAD